MTDDESTARTPVADFKDDASVDPYPRYAHMRAHCPVPQVIKGSGIRPYLITRYGDAKAALIDPRLLKDPRAGAEALTEAGIAHLYLGGGNTLSNHMLSTDPPDHTRLRRLVAGQFTMRRTAALTPRIQEITTSLIDAFAPLGRAEFMTAFAGQLPSLVIAELLGVPASDRDAFRGWASDSLLPPSDPRQLKALLALSSYVESIVAAKRTAPADDLISGLITDQSSDRLSEDELLGSIKLLIIAGNETTINLLGNGLFALLRHPSQLDLLRSRPELIPNAIEEFLRYDAPVERATMRFAGKDVQIGETSIPRGSIVYVVLGSANRDPDQFPDADRFDVTRASRGHLTFGHGLHFCLGAPLARLGAKIAFESLLSRLPELELDARPEDIPYQLSSIMHGLASLPIRFRTQ